MTNPSDVLSDLPTPAREETRKTVYDKRPGHISWASDRANFSGCRIITFTGSSSTPPYCASGLEAEDAARFAVEVDEYLEKVFEQEDEGPIGPADLANLYFSKRANLLTLHMMHAPDELIFVITSQLDDDDLEEFEEVQRRVNLEMREWREKREQLRQAEQEKQLAEKKLAEIGRKAQEYNLFEKLRKLEAENQELKKKVTDAS